jgi:hypothetical protein
MEDMFGRTAELILSIIMLAVTGFIIPLIKGRVSAERYEQMREWADTAVRAAEMIFSGKGEGEHKFDYVSDFLQTKGLKEDDMAFMALIEQAVYDMKNLESEARQ